MINELEFLKKLREVLKHSKVASTMLENRIKELDAQDNTNENHSQQEEGGDTLTQQPRLGTHPEEGQVSKENDKATVDTNDLCECGHPEYDHDMAWKTTEGKECRMAVCSCEKFVKQNKQEKTIGCVGCETDNLKREDVSYVKEDSSHWYCNDCIKENNLTKIFANPDKGVQK